MFLAVIISCMLYLEVGSSGLLNPGPNPDSKCQLSSELKQEIVNYKQIVQKIYDHVVKGSGKHKLYKQVEDFVDRFGSRFAGTDNLEHSIDYAKKLLEEHGLENVRTESVTIPQWVRGEERASLIEPFKKNLPMLGLGTSIATPKEGITAEVLVVNTYDELQEKSHEANGKIVVFNQKFVDYSSTVQYRLYGASKAAVVGAVAVLIRSVADFSISTPHTGLQVYDSNVTKIPAACITIEDAEMLWRMSQKKEKIVIHLEMNAENLPDKESRNTIGEVGGKDSSEIVLISGHIDSWDVGTGAMDDAAGAFVSWYSLAIMKELNLQPRRTLRSILWTSEEVGLIGAKAYFEAHQNELANYSAVLESDLGTFQPIGLTITQSDEESVCILAEIVKLFSFMNASTLQTTSVGNSDTDVFTSTPQVTLLTDSSTYFWFHHTEGDTLEREDPDVLDRCLVVWASTGYIIADMSAKLKFKGA